MSQDILNIAPPLPTQAQPPPLPADKEAAKAQDKAAKMTRAGELYTAAQQAKEAWEAAEKAAGDFVNAEIAKVHGLGPHGIRVAGKAKIVHFQRVNKTIRANFLDLADVDIPQG